MLAAVLGCGGSPEPVDPAASPEPTAGSEPGQPETPVKGDRVELVPDCTALAQRALASDADLALIPVLCPGLNLDHSALRKIVLASTDAVSAYALIPLLDREAELQGLVRLATLDRASQALPDQLPDPATALLTPIDDRLLAAAELAHAQLRSPELDESTRTRAHAYLARVYFEALEALGLPAGRPLPPFARLLAGPALFHGRSFCRFYWQRRIAGLERNFADTELALLALLIDLDNTPDAGDPGLLVIERERTRSYLLREGPTARIAKRSQSRPDARALGTDLLMPFVQELDRMFDHGFVDLALARALRAGGQAGGYGLDPMIAVVTEDLRARDLREYERRLAKRVEAARRRTPRSRQGEGAKPIDAELPVEWPTAAAVADQAQAWLGLAYGRGPDFARRHALARTLRLLADRPDALLALAERDAPAVRAHAELLRTCFEAIADPSLASMRAGVDAGWDQDRDALRRRFALATRDALLHPR